MCGTLALQKVQSALLQCMYHCMFLYPQLELDAWCCQLLGMLLRTVGAVQYEAPLCTNDEALLVI